MLSARSPQAKRGVNCARARGASGEMRSSRPLQKRGRSSLQVHRVATPPCRRPCPCDTIVERGLRVDGGQSSGLERPARDRRDRSARDAASGADWSMAAGRWDQYHRRWLPPCGRECSVRLTVRRGGPEGAQAGRGMTMPRDVDALKVEELLPLPPPARDGQGVQQARQGGTTRPALRNEWPCRVRWLRRLLNRQGSLDGVNQGRNEAELIS